MQAPTTTLAPPPTADQALRDLAAQPWMPIALIVGTVVAAFVLVTWYRRHAGRARQIEHAAQASGYRYTPVDGSGLANVRFASFAGGHGVDLSNVVIAASADGATVRAFDYSTWVDVPVDDGGDVWGSARGDETPGSRRTRRVTAGTVGSGAAVRLPGVYLPRLTVRPESLRTRAVDALGGRDLQLESDEFNRIFDIRSEDRRFAELFLDPQMMNLLLETEGKVSVEVFGNWLLLTTALAGPDDLIGLLRYALVVRAAVPDLITEMYPDAERAAHEPGFRLGT